MTGSPSSKFIEPKRFSVIRFIPEEATEGQGLQVVLYEHQAGDIQAAVVVIGPSSFSSQFRQRMEMALQTLSVQPQVATQIDKTTGTTQQGGVSGFWAEWLISLFYESFIESHHDGNHVFICIGVGCTSAGRIALDVVSERWLSTTSFAKSFVQRLTPTV